MGGAGLAIALILMIAGTGILLPGAVLVCTLLLLFAPIAGRPAAEWGRAGARFVVGMVLTISPASQSINGFAPDDENEDSRAIDYEIVDGEHGGLIKTGKSHVVVFSLSGGRDFALAGQDEQDEIVSGWSAFLASFARENSAIKRLQILIHSAPQLGSAATQHLEAAHAASPEALQTYGQLLTMLGSDTTVHSMYLAAAVQPRSIRDVVRSAENEATGILRALEARRITVHRLSTQEIRGLIGAISDPVSDTLRETAGLADYVLPAPQPTRREDVGGMLVGATRHRSFEITEWPRIPVLADWLYPLLSGRLTGNKTVSIQIEALPAWKAVRRAEQAATNAASEMRRRGQMGFEARARDTKALEAITDREDELAGGHAGVKISGVITVSAAGREALESASRDVVDMASKARLQVRPLWCQGQEALEASLPLCHPMRAAQMHETTTRHAGSLYPLQVSGDLGIPGVAIGWDALSGGAFAYDPFEFYKHNIIKSPNMVVMGKIGRGKSAFVKSYLYRQAAIFGRRVWVAGDPKGEYAPLAQACGLPIVHLEPGGTTRINPLDPGTETDTSVTSSRRSDLLAALVGTQLKRDLSPGERAALNGAIADLGVDAMLQDVVELLFHPSEAMCDRANATGQQLAADSRDIALELNRLVTGDLAGMFDGSSTVAVNDSRGGVIDLSGVYSHQSSLVPIMICVTHWLTQQLLQRDNQTIIVLDEAWQALAAAGVADWAQATAKLARAFGVQLVIVLHRLADLAAVGADDAAVTKKAQGLFEDADTIVSFAQHPKSLPATQEAMSLSDNETALLERLETGRCLFITGARHSLVDVALTSLELAIANTDQAM
jgi:hypothetical protein